MTPNQMTIAAVTACTLFVAVLAFRNSRTEAENLALFQLKGELKAARWLPALILGMGLFASLMALIVDHGGRDRTWGLAVIGLIGMIFGYFMTLFSVRLEQDAIRFGFLSRRRIGYSEITEFARIHVGKGSECYLVLSSGGRVKLGEDLAYEKMLADEFSGVRDARSSGTRRACHIPKASSVANALVSGPGWGLRRRMSATSRQSPATGIGLEKVSLECLARRVKFF